MGALRGLLELNRRLSEAVHRLLPARLRTDGNEDFRRAVPWRHVAPGARVVDLGGGRGPFFDRAAKERLGLTVVGVDVSAAELGAAPSGSYDDTRVTDACGYRGEGDADLLVCQALFEHLDDVPAAVAGIRSSLRRGGVACVFVPCRNAPYARLNRLLPEGLKRRLLHAIYPGTRGRQGFPSRYRHCTPSELERLFREHGFELVEERRYHVSRYFFCCFPVYLVWQAWAVAAAVLAPRRGCETMSLVFRLRAPDGELPQGRQRRPQVNWGRSVKSLSSKS